MVAFAYVAGGVKVACQFAQLCILKIKISDRLSRRSWGTARTIDPNTHNASGGFMRRFHRRRQRLLPELQQILRVLVSTIALLTGAVTLCQQLHHRSNGDRADSPSAFPVLRSQAPNGP